MTISPQYGAPKRRPNMRKAVFLFPSGLTLLNLFFGIFAIIAASRLEFTIAGVYVVIGGICDALDGRVARATNAGTQFGEELDSLVDAITFGLAPGMIMYFAVLNRGGWDWVWVFAFSAAAVLRLARFNIEQAGTAKTYFQGLPSPAAGITLASYYWFSQSSLYNVTQVWFTQTGVMARLPWHYALRLLIAVLAALMISNVPYPTFPRTGFRSLRALGATFVVFGGVALLVTGRLEYFFPLALIYVAFGLVRWLLAGFFERRQPTVPYDLSEGEDDEDDTFEVAVPAAASRSGRREERSAGNTKQRGRLDRPERSERPARPERGHRTEPTIRAAQTDTPERAVRGEKAERPQRTDAERAARREKRDKREGRQERGPRAEQAPVQPPATGVSAIVVGDTPTAEPVPTEEVIGRLPGAAEPDAAPAEGAPARKRKRRRRRGDRKDRSGTPQADGSASTDEGLDDQGSDTGGDDDSRSPYSTPTSAYTPPVPPSYTPPAAPQPPAAPPALPSTPSSDSSE